MKRGFRPLGPCSMDVSHPMALAPIEHPAPAERRVPPKHDAHPRPRLAKTLDRPRQYRPRVPRRIDVRRAKVRDQELAAAKRIQRQETVPVVVPVKEPPRLMAVHRVVGRVEVNHQLARRAPVRGNELLHQDLVNRHRPLPLGPALEPAQRRGRLPATRLVHTLSAPPHRGEAHRGRSDLRSPPPPRAPVGAPSSPLRDEPSRAGAGHRAPAPPGRSGPICGPPRAVTTPRRSMKSSRRKNPPAPAAAGSLKTSSHRGYIVSPSGFWLDTVQATES